MGHGDRTTYLLVFILRICKISGLRMLVRLDVLDLHGNQASLRQFPLFHPNIKVFPGVLS